MNLESNTLFACEALILLERLPFEAVALAYLDPPWTTGTGLRRTETKAEGMSAEGYASYLSKVVQQVRRVLTDTGSLFAHCSHATGLDVRLVMNQAFGEQPKYEITWPRKQLWQFASNGPRVDNEFILVYSKADAPTYNNIFRPPSSEQESAYTLSDVRGPYRAADLTASFDRPAGRYTWRGHQPPTRRSWKFSPEKLEDLFQDNRIHFPSAGGLPRLKQYLADHPGIEVGTNWEDIPFVVPRTERTGSASQRPFALMERIIQRGSNAQDRVLDLFCGSGTTIIAAQSLGRRWWAIDNSVEANRIVIERLSTHCGLTPTKDYAVSSEADVIERPVIHASYRDTVSSVRGIAALQQDLSSLTDHLLSLKRRMNIGDDDDARVEDAIAEMQHWIANSIVNQTRSVDSYVSVVCAWLTGWDQLDTASQSFLPQAELLFENISRTSGQDYSPFIIQYCRALENELLTKLFVAYTGNVHQRHNDIDQFLAQDIDGGKTSAFAKSVQKRECTYTLGTMTFIMGLMKAGGTNLGRQCTVAGFSWFYPALFQRAHRRKDISRPD